MTERFSIEQWQAKVHSTALSKGWYEGVEPADVKLVPEKLALLHSEVSEALEEYRNGKMAIYYEESGKPAGFGIEIADVVIRAMDLMGFLGLNLEDMVRIKHEYNVTRPHRHGGKRC